MTEVEDLLREQNMILREEVVELRAQNRALVHHIVEEGAYERLASSKRNAQLDGLLSMAAQVFSAVLPNLIEDIAKHRTERSNGRNESPPPVGN